MWPLVRGIGNERVELHCYANELCEGELGHKIDEGIFSHELASRLSALQLDVRAVRTTYRCKRLKNTMSTALLSNQDP